MSSSAYSKRLDLPWTPGEKERLWKLKTTGETKDLSWDAFHMLKHFPDRSKSAVQVQWSRLRAERGLPRQRRARGSLDGVVPAKRSAAHSINVRGSAKYRRVSEDADGDEEHSNGVDTPHDTEATEDAGTASNESERYLNHDSQAPDEAQRLSLPGSEAHQAAALHPAQSSTTMLSPGAATSQQALSIAFTPVNLNHTAQETTIHESRSTPLQVPPMCPTQTPDSDERNLLETLGTSSRASPHSERTGRLGTSTDLNPPSLEGSTAAEPQQLPHPLGLPREDEQLETQAGHTPLAQSPTPKSPRLEKASEGLVGHVKSFTKEVERMISDLTCGASLKQKELSLLQDSHKDLLIERDELREKYTAEIREKEGYKKEVEDLKAELEQMKEEMRRVEEDKKKISGVCKTLEELVGLMKH
ncbi:hypothetical protein BDW75DRAFT_249276 [Aspergillus navahoensis]